MRPRESPTRMLTLGLLGLVMCRFDDRAVWQELPGPALSPDVEGSLATQTYQVTVTSSIMHQLDVLELEVHVDWAEMVDSGDTADTADSADTADTGASPADVALSIRTLDGHVEEKQLTIEDGSWTVYVDLGYDWCDGAEPVTCGLEVEVELRALTGRGRAARPGTTVRVAAGSGELGFCAQPSQDEVEATTTLRLEAIE